MSDYENFVKLLQKAKMDFEIRKNLKEITIRVYSDDTGSLDFFFFPDTEEIHEFLT